MTTMTLHRYAEVRAALADPRFDVPTAPPGAAGLAWLRGAVCRFSRGPAHVRRRGYAQAVLGDLSPAELRARAQRATAASPGLAVSVLAEAMGLRVDVRANVAAIAAEYFAPTGARADDDVIALVRALAGGYDEPTAARMALLVQAHGATDRLIAAALTVPRRSHPVEVVLAETLRHSPPVPMMRRECVVGHDNLPAGALVLLDLAAANRDPDIFVDPDRFDAGRPEPERHLTFGSGPRACPGREHAIGLAAGAVTGIVHNG